jgi:MFS transporter, DHA1 family, multidrug resistance protein B
MKRFFALHSNVRIRIGLALVGKLIDAMILTFIAIYLAARVGTALTGALILLFALFAVFGMLAGGHLSETRGRRPVLSAGDLIGCAFLVLMAVAYYDRWGPFAVYFSYAIAKFGSNMALPANDATIIDVTPPADRRYVYTVNYWVVNLALGGGALVGGILYSEHFGAVIVGGAVGLGVAFLVTVLFIEETRPALTGDAPPAKSSGLGRFVEGYRVVLLDSTFRRLVIAASLSMALENQLTGYLGIRLSNGVPTQHLLPFLSVNGVQLLGVLRSENSILVVVMALFINAVLSRASDRVRLYVGCALYAGGFAVLAITDTAWVMLLACLVLTIGELMNVPVKQSLLAELAPERGRSRYMAAYYLNIRFGQVLNSLLISLSVLVTAAGMAAIYLVFGVLMILQYRTILAARRGGPAKSRSPVPSASTSGTPTSSPVEQGER